MDQKENLSPIKQDDFELENFDEGSKMFQETDEELQSKLQNLFQNDGVDSKDEGLIDEMFKDAAQNEDDYTENEEDIMEINIPGMQQQLDQEHDLEKELEKELKQNRLEKEMQHQLENEL